jgi:hypothetical protein
MFNQKKTAFLAKKLILFCPFTISNGLILQRDIWVTTLFVACLFFFIKKKYISSIIMMVFTGYFRFGSLVFIAVGIMIILKYKLDLFFPRGVKSTLFYILIIVFVLICFYNLIPFLVVISAGKLQSGLFRENFLWVFENNDQNSFILKLAKMPVFPRTMLFTLFFLFDPFLKRYSFSGDFHIVWVMMHIVTPIYLFFCWPNIGKSFLYSLNNKLKVKYIIVIAILGALCLGTFSLQERHKTILMPILYVLTAYGWYTSHKKFKIISFFLTTIVVFVNLISLTR